MITPTEPIEHHPSYYTVPTVHIDGNVASSKNGKQWTGKFLVMSKQTQTYIKESKPDYIYNKDKFLKALEGKSAPYHISFLFVRKSRHKFDYVNPLQTVLDLMVDYGYIEDDNADLIIPYFEEYEYDKEEPGCFITVHSDVKGAYIQKLLRWPDDDLLPDDVAYPEPVIRRYSSEEQLTINL